MREDEVELETPALSIDSDCDLDGSSSPAVLIWENVRIVWWCIRWGLFWLLLSLGLF